MRRASPLVALVATLAIQVFVSLIASAGPVLMPEIAPQFGVAPQWIGVFIGITYAGAMVASLAGGAFIARYGAIRVSQVCVALAMAGVLIGAATPPGAGLLFVAAALVMGVSYGPVTPASSHILIKTAPPAKLALTFSIKQTGVPAGAALAGAILPALSLAFGWRGAIAVVAAAGIAVIAAAQPIRAALDADLAPRRRLSFAAILEPLGVVRRSRALLELALIAFCYAATQVCITSFLVVYLTDAQSWSLVAAGLALTVTTVGGVAGRILWGYVADRLGAPRTVLGVVGLVACAGGLMLALAGPGWPPAALLAVVGVLGGTAIGWNGVHLAEVARHAPPGAAGAVTGAAGFIGFAGLVAGPPVFAGLATATGDYRVGFAAFALSSGAGGLAMLLRRPHAARRSTVS